MKQQLPFPLPASALLRSCVLGLALAATPALAQETPPEAEPFVTVAPGPKVIGEINLQNVKVGEAAEYIAELTGANILVAADAQDFPIPAMKLRNVTVSGVFRAIDRSGVPVEISETAAKVPGEAPVWVVAGRAVPDPLPNQTKIFNLSPVYIESITSADPAPEAFKRVAEVITDAVKEALATRAASTQAKPGATVIKVHEATRLMIVCGKPEDVDIARQVICVLGGKSVE